MVFESPVLQKAKEDILEQLGPHLRWIESLSSLLLIVACLDNTYKLLGHLMNIEYDLFIN